MILVINTENKKLTFLGSFRLEEIEQQKALMEHIGSYATVNVRDVLETEEKKLLEELEKFHQGTFTK